jgi:Uncharacterised protein family (UPF0175)
VVLRIHLPDDVTKSLEDRWGDLPRHVIETLALEGYRDGTLSAYQIQCMLGFRSRLEVDDFMKNHGVPMDYRLEDLDGDAERLRTLRPARSK